MERSHNFSPQVARQSNEFVQFLRGCGFDKVSLAAEVDNGGKEVFSSNGIKCMSNSRLQQLSREVQRVEPQYSYSIFGEDNRVVYLVNVSKERHFAFFGRTTYGSFEGLTERDTLRVNDLIASHERLLGESGKLASDEWLLVECENPSKSWPAAGRAITPGKAWKSRATAP
ncbi:MAG: hypothetical protein LBD33_00100 [Puniceicoccales bacterium]|jgi:hypothetical protein|nr:hypothetical protein [Puniceicoccales bacterium]